MSSSLIIHGRRNAAKLVLHGFASPLTLDQTSDRIRRDLPEVPQFDKGREDEDDQEHKTGK